MFDNVQQRKSSTTPPPMPGITPLVASSVGSYVNKLVFFFPLIKA